ncbi:MAG: thiamine pyrophosphate-dependent dehydrogenase E1 component subunit alpha [Candidatus Omnitrophota bacterium]
MKKITRRSGKIRSLRGAALADLYACMSRIRLVEEAIEEFYPADEMKTPVHLCIGQEAIAAGVALNLKKEDLLFSNHRGHGHYLAKGGDLNAMMAELYCRESGCSKGRGGSMHLVDTAAGLPGSSSIVGGDIPVAVGAALAISMQKKPLVSAVFFGDAATEEGVFYESVNFAVLKKLPVIFVCENNFYSVCSHQGKRQAIDNIYERLEKCGIPGHRVDGCDAIEAYRVSKSCIDRARSGKGPSLIECRAYRWRGHAGAGPDYKMGHRTKAELDGWVRKCPIRALRYILSKERVLSKEELDGIERSIKKEISAAFEYARKSPLPRKEEVGKYLYS